jgi:hypothetical protein
LPEEARQRALRQLDLVEPASAQYVVDFMKNQPVYSMKHETA